MIGSFTDIPEVLEFINSHSAEELAYLGTSCPDHFIRTKIRPLFVDWDQSRAMHRKFSRLRKLRWRTIAPNTRATTSSTH